MSVTFVDYLLAVIFLYLSAEKGTQVHSRNLEERRIYYVTSCFRPYEKMTCDLHLIETDTTHIFDQLKFPKTMIYITIQYRLHNVRPNICEDDSFLK